MVSVWINLVGPFAGLFSSNGGTKCSDMVEVRLAASKCLERGCSNSGMVCSIVEICCVNQGVTPELGSEVAAIEHTSHHVGEGSVWTFTPSILCRVVSAGGFE